MGLAAIGVFVVEIDKEYHRINKNNNLHNSHEERIEKLEEIIKERHCV